MKKLFCVVLGMMFFLVPFLTGCKRDDGITIDSSKTQLRVGNCANGYGTAWFDELSRMFEEKYKNYSFEEGKVGVQIVPSTAGYDGPTLINSLANSTTDVIFSEEMYYFDYVSRGLLKDISEIVKTPLTEFGESESIYQKLDPQYQTALEGYDGNIYALPWWTGLRCIIYDIDLFEDRGFFIAKNGAPSEAYVEDENGNVIGEFNGEYLWTKTGEKSAGPDGKYGTYDDGCPATYEEFYALCDRIRSRGVTPLIWTGQYPGYSDALIRDLYTDYEGYENIRMLYDLDGVSDDVVASFTEDADGTISNITYEKDSPDAEGLTITYENGYKLHTTAGKLYALSFAKKLINSNWYSDKCFTGSESHTQAQRSFLYGKYEDKLEDCAMLLDGSWWINEADPVMSSMDGVYEKSSRQERQLGSMPLPKATQEKVGEPTTKLSYKNAYCFVNAKCTGGAWEAAKAYMRFVHSDEGLKTFTRVSSAIRPFDYEYTEDELKELDSFGRSMYEENRNYTLVYPIATTPLYINNMSYFVGSTSYGWESIINNQTESFAIQAIHDQHLSVTNYFEGIKKQYSKENWDARFKTYYNTVN